MKLVSIYDAKAQAFMKPIFFDNHAMAIRAFRAATLEEGSDFHRFAEDYTLFAIGEFDPNDGSLFNYESNVPLATALQFQAENTPLKLAGENTNA